MGRGVLGTAQEGDGGMRVDQCYCRECERPVAQAKRHGIYPESPTRLRIDELLTGRTVASGTEAFVRAVARWL